MPTGHAMVMTPLGDRQAALAMSTWVMAELGTQPPAAEDDGESVRFAMPAATFTTADASFRVGEGGSNYFGAFVAIVGDGMADHAWYFTHNGFGWNPQPYNASLTGFTMHAVNLAAGNRTAAQVATALRSAIDGEGLYETVGGASGNVDVTGAIDAAACFTGEASPGTAASWGDHNAATSGGGAVVNALHAHSVFTAGPALVTGIGAPLSNDSGNEISLALFTGGTAASGGSGVVNPTPDWDDTDLFCESVVISGDGGGTAWTWRSLTPDQVAELADNTNVQHMLKGNTAAMLIGFRSTGDMGTSDLTAQQIALVDAGDIDPDANVAWPTTLEGVSLAGSFSVVMQCAFEYRQAPHRGDAGGITVSVL